VPKKKNLEVRKRILEVWKEGYRSPSMIANKLNMPVTLVKYYMHQMRGERLLPSTRVEGSVLDEALDLLKAMSLRLAFVSGELATRGDDKLLKPIRDCEKFTRQCMDLIQIHIRMQATIKGEYR